MHVSLRQVAEVICAVQDNAEELLSEAELLLANARAARAYALAHMACEELAKVPILFGIAGRLLNGMEVNWKGTWRRFNSHASKLNLFGQLLENALIQARPQSLDHPLLAAAIDLPDDIPEARNKALYVDLDRTGCSRPSDTIRQHHAKAMISLGKDHLALAGRTCGRDKDALVVAFPRLAKKWQHAAAEAGQRSPLNV